MQGMQQLKKQVDHSLFVSETGTGLLVSFAPHPDAPEKPYIAD
jgi:hypothetical protein